MAPGRAADDLPVLIVGDVHGDIERLFQALKPYPSDQWHTVFIGDLVDYGMFGTGALRFARDRPNSSVLLGNHEVALLWALRDRPRLGWWISIGGQRHDFEEVAKDDLLQAWLRDRPALIKLHDGTLVQHCGHDAYSRWFDKSADPIATVNAHVHELLNNNGEAELWDVTTARPSSGTSSARRTCSRNSRCGYANICRQRIVAASCSGTHRTAVASPRFTTTASRSISMARSRGHIENMRASRR